MHLYKLKPLEYISSLIGDEGKGSLISYLRKRLWALALYVGNGQTGAEQNSIFTLFTINITLTKEGFQNLDEVIGAVFSYINLLKELGPSKQYFDELKQIHKNAFRYSKEADPVEYVEDLAESMQIYASEHFITGSELFFDYDEKEIKNCLSALRPEKMNIMIMTNELPKGIKYDQSERWFNTVYKCVGKYWALCHKYSIFLAIVIQMSLWGLFMSCGTFLPCFAC